MRIPSLATLMACLFLSSAVHAQEAAPPDTRTASANEGGSESASEGGSESEGPAARVESEEDESGDESEDDSEDESEDESEDGSESEPDASLSTAVFPPPPPRPPEDPEDPEDEGFAPVPPPEPQWRLRLGVGATAATAGGPVVSLRLLQELEWMPPEVAPLLFSLTGGEVLGEYTMGLGGARIGLYGMFCQDRIVTCTGAVAIRGGVVAGTPGVSFDLGGDGDARFRFDGVELAIRVGFFVIQGVTFVDALGMVGAAF